MDSYFSSHDLALFLKTEGTDCAGTLHVNRKKFFLLSKQKNLRNGETVGQHSTDVAGQKEGDIISTNSTTMVRCVPF
jgi:hypothetical protein